MMIWFFFVRAAAAAAAAVSRDKALARACFFPSSFGSVFFSWFLMTTTTLFI
jgi:hypothetical protein